MKIKFRSILIHLLLACVALPIAIVPTAFAQQKSLYNGDQKRVALVIRVSDYEHTSALPNPVNDARDVGDALERLGFSTIRLSNPKVNDFERLEFELFKQLKGADVAVLYYAGHSVQVDGSNYLIPIDATLQSISAINVRPLNWQSSSI